MEKTVRFSQIVRLRCLLSRNQQFSQVHKPFAASVCCLNTAKQSRHSILSTNFAFQSAAVFQKHDRTLGLNVSQIRSYSDYPAHSKVTLPALSPTMELGTIVSWEKKEGDHVKEGDLLAEIETDKATMGFEATEEGYLAKIFVPGGTKGIPVGSLLCVIVENEDDISKFANAKVEELLVLMTAPSAAAPPSAPAVPSIAQQQTAQDKVVADQAVASQQQAVSDAPGQRVKASPYAKLLAKEKGIDLSQIKTASGSDGRIVSTDVENFKPSSAPAAVSSTGTSAAPGSIPTAAPGAAFVDIPLTNVRSVIAKRLTEAKQKIPHYYLTVEITMDKVVELRKDLNKELESRKVKLSVNDFVIKAAAVSLRRVPGCNSSWQETFIRQYNNADISVAVASERGLITPIVFNADAKGLIAINSDVLALAEKARSGKLKPQEFQGGTFTISNLGMFGIKSFSAIINPPQACILAVGGAEQKVVPDGDGFKTVPVMSCTLCCDHRVVDGAMGANWLSEFKKCLEDPYNMLL